MDIDNTFTVNAPIDRVWPVLMDVDAVAGCVPGAQVLGQLSDDEFQVGMKVRLGPISMQYRGQLSVLERDEANHRAVLRGSAKETRGQGTAAATVEMRLAESEGRTSGTVHADVRLSGRVAAMGRNVIADVADQILAQFVRNLEERLGAADVGAGRRESAAGAAADHGRSGTTVVEAVERLAAGTASEGVVTPPEEAQPRRAPVEHVRADADMTRGQVVTGPGTSGGLPAEAPSAAVSGGAQSLIGARMSDRISAEESRPTLDSVGASAQGGDHGASLDGLALARGVATARMRDPRVAFGLVALVAVVSFWLGRGFRRHAAPAYTVDDLERLASLVASRRG